MVRMNSPSICTMVPNLMVTPSSLKIPPTTVNRMIATASLIIPSPNTIENSLGYLLGLIMVKAATESEAQIVALYLMIRALERVIILSKLVQLRMRPRLRKDDRAS